MCSDIIEHYARQLEEEPSLMGASFHLLGIARVT
jgi:hypothetical protein